MALDGEELAALVNKTRSGDLSAYGEIVRRFQDMAVGYSYSLLGDFHLAEDAAQEAFIGAYLDLTKLKEPAAFPNWFRRIVFKYCDRIVRKKFVPLVPLDAVGEISSSEKGPDTLLEGKELQGQVSTAVQLLPEHQRLVVNLFYIGEYSHNEVAAFLGISVQMVKNRLHASRKLLKRELIDMARKKLQKQRPSKDQHFVTHVMDELTEISDAGIQYLLRETELENCILALKGASDKVKEKLLGNMAQRVRTFIEEALELSQEVDESKIQQAQKVVMEGLQKIRRKPGKLSQEYLGMKRKLKKSLQERPVSRLNCDEITDLFYDLSSIVYEEGLLALAEFEEIIRQDEDDKLLSLGLYRTIAGVESEVNTQILEKRTRILLREQEIRYRMFTEGIALLQKRCVPAWMQHQLRAHYILEKEKDLEYLKGSSPV